MMNFRSCFFHQGYARLLRQGASPFVRNKYGEIASELTPVSSMMYSTLKGYELLYSVSQAAVIRLIRQGANINFQDLNTGYTPLHIAVEDGNAEMVEFLLQNDANLDATTHSGKNVFDLVDSQPILELLEAYVDFEPDDPDALPRSRADGPGFFMPSD